MIKKILVLLIILGAPIYHASAEGAPIDTNNVEVVPPAPYVANPAAVCEATYPDHGPDFGECVSAGRPARTHR